MMQTENQLLIIFMTLLHLKADVIFVEISAYTHLHWTFYRHWPGCVVDGSESVHVSVLCGFYCHVCQRFRVSSVKCAVWTYDSFVGRYVRMSLGEHLKT